MSPPVSYRTEELAGPGQDGDTGGLRLSRMDCGNGHEQGQDPDSLCLGKKGRAGDIQEASVIE